MFSVRRINVYGARKQDWNPCPSKHSTQRGESFRAFDHSLTETMTRAPQQKSKRAIAGDLVNYPLIEGYMYIENLKSGGGLTAFEEAYASWG